jgi:hypothetical protein
LHVKENPMKTRVTVVAALAAAVLVAAARAERPPEQRDEAKLVVAGTVQKVTTKKDKFGGDGVRTDYTAEVAVDKVEKGEGVKAGETIKVSWFRVTKNPSRPFVGAFGHAYKIKEKDRARFWLMGSPRTGWTVIYNSDGVEKLKK